MKKYLEYKDHVSNKFWEINLKGPQVNLTYGRIGISNPAKITPAKTDLCILRASKTGRLYFLSSK